MKAEEQVGADGRNVARCGETPHAAGSGQLRTGRALPVAEDFYTIQGEGHNTGRAAYFIRLAGCDVRCPWCDAKYTWNAGGLPYTDIGEVVARAAASGAPCAVITGGEPLMHPLGPLTEALKAHGMEVLLETSGTHPPQGRFDWICLSPKRQAPPLDAVCRMADELKVVIATADDFAWAETCAARTGSSCLLYLQPEWSRFAEAAALVAEYAKARPQWRISLQTHKFMDIP